MRCVMNVKILTTRYKTPSFIKLIGSILFIAVVVLMIAMPVFELIPQGQYIAAFNYDGALKEGATYTSETYTVFTMMQHDYGNAAAMAIMMTQCIIGAVTGVALLWMNRPKLAAIPAAVICWTIIFSVFRATQTGVNKVLPAKLFDGPEFWTSVNKNISSLDGPFDTMSKGTYVQQYTIDKEHYIFSTFGRYWLIWVAGCVLLACVIAAILLTKTMIEKKKK